MNRSSILVCAVLLCCMLVQWPDSHNVCSVNPNFVQHFVSRELSHLKYVIVSAVFSALFLQHKHVVCGDTACRKGRVADF